MLEHSKAKVELYGRYLSKYLTILLRDVNTNNIYLYDLFCGAGIYENQGKGSPIVALDIIKDTLLNSTSKTKIKVLFNDKEESKIESLKQIISSQYQTNNCEIRFKQEQYDEILDFVRKELTSFKQDRSKGLIFIDPYGYKEINVNDIKNLLLNKQVEILLFLPITFMYRFTGKATQDKEALPYIKPLKTFIESLFGESIPKFVNEIDYIKVIKSGWENYLKDYYVETFYIERDTNSAFCLFFFTSHIYGLEKIIEAKWQIDGQRGQGFRLNPTLDMFLHEDFQKFENLLADFIKSGERFCGDIYVFTLKNGFLPIHTNKILKNWQNQNILLVESPKGEKIRKGSFFINKDDKDKVFFYIN